MNPNLHKNDSMELAGPAHSDAAMAVAIEFSAEPLIYFPIKIQMQNSMSTPNVPPTDPLIPSLFQIAARADDPSSLMEFKRKITAGHAPHAEKMLDKGKLEAILDAITRKKKPARRVTTVRLEKRLALNESQAA